eukprot:150448-Chlamydomonas_euryale.AAC.4
MSHRAGLEAAPRLGGGPRLGTLTSPTVWLQPKQPAPTRCAPQLAAVPLASGLLPRPSGGYVPPGSASQRGAVAALPRRCNALGRRYSSAAHLGVSRTRPEGAYLSVEHRAPFGTRRQLINTCMKKGQVAPRHLPGGRGGLLRDESAGGRAPASSSAGECRRKRGSGRGAGGRGGRAAVGASPRRQPCRRPRINAPVALPQKGTRRCLFLGPQRQVPG